MATLGKVAERAERPHKEHTDTERLDFLFNWLRHNVPAAAMAFRGGHWGGDFREGLDEDMAGQGSP